jgi:putative membrane protein
MAFGFLMEKFDLFLRYSAPGQQHLTPRSETFSNWGGLAFIVLGIAMIALAGWRFVKTAKDIDSRDEVASPGERFDLVLAVLIGLLGVSPALYMSVVNLSF